MGRLAALVSLCLCLCGHARACVAGEYQDRGACPLCPAHTTTTQPGGGVTVHDCRCEPGYLCMYYKQVHATVTLNSTLHDFEGDRGGVRTAFLAGVAAAAGVAREQVRIHFVVIRLSHRRRLLRWLESIRVNVVVSGTSGDSLGSLHRHLSALGGGGSWEVRRRVLVLAIPLQQRGIQEMVAVEQNT
jgi:hypothetical protein